MSNMVISPLLLALAVNQIASGVQSEHKVWYLDDPTIGGSTESVLNDVLRCESELKRIGVEVDAWKTEISNVGLADSNFSRVVDIFNILLPQLKVNEMKLLRSLIQNDETRSCNMMKLSEYKRMNDRILLLDGQQGLFSHPRLLLSLRTTPCHNHPELQAEYDEVTRSTTEALSNVHLDDNS